MYMYMYMVISLTETCTCTCICLVPAQHLKCSFNAPNAFIKGIEANVHNYMYMQCCHVYINHQWSEGQYVMENY